MRTKQLDSETLLTTAEVGALLQVHPNSVINWARQGEIICFRTPGGQRRIRAVDVVKFVKQRGMPVPRYLLGLEASRVVVLDLTAKDSAAVKKTAKALPASVTTPADVLECVYEMGLKPPTWCIVAVDDIKDERLADLMKLVERRKDLTQVNFAVVVPKVERKVKQVATRIGVRTLLDRPLDAERATRELNL